MCPLLSGIEVVLIDVPRKLPSVARHTQKLLEKRVSKGQMTKEAG
jgi:hypothetical protein